MRLNKKKLAALAMSAVMAASTMPFPVLAEEFTDGDVVAVETFEETATVPANASEVTVSKVDFDKETATATVTYSNEVVKKDLPTEKEIVSDATCDKPEYYILYVVVDGKKYSSTKFDGNPALGHDYKTSFKVDTAATCHTEGKGHYVKKCTRCNDEIADSENPGDKTIEKTDHNWSDAKVKYVILTGSTLTQKDQSEVPVLKDGATSGSYEVVTYQECKNDGCSASVGGYKELKSETVNVYPTDWTETSKVVTLKDKSNKDNSNIAGLYDAATDTVKAIADNTDLAKFDASQVVLKDCSKEGTYYVVSLDAKGNEITREAMTIPAGHHVAAKPIVKAKDSKEADLLDTKWDEKNKEWIVTSKSCYIDVTYTETVKCATTKTTGVKCNLTNSIISTTEKVAKAAGSHVISTESKTAITNAQNDVATNGYLSKAGYNALKAAADKTGSGIKLVRDGGCVEEGTVTVSYLCQICGEETGKAVTLKLGKQGHDWGENTSENKVEPTCSEMGSYDVVHTCKVCGEKEIVTADVKINKTAHSFVKDNKIDQTDAYIEFSGTVVVDEDGDNLDLKGKDFDSSAQYKSFTVTAKPVVKCEICGETESILADKNATLGLKVVDIKKESAKGEAGSITLKATSSKTVKVSETETKTEKMEATYTVPYYSNIVSYLDRKPEADGLKLDSDGTFRYYENGVFKKDFNGIADYDGAKFFVKDGILAKDLNHVQLSPDGKDFYYLTDGRITTEYTGLNPYDGEFFYVVNGKIDLTKNGLVEYNGKKFLVAVGRKVAECNGLWQDFDGTWYFLANGEVQDQYTGTTTYDGKTFTLENGKLVG